MSERTLLRDLNYRKQKGFKYNFQLIRSKGAIVLLFVDAFIQVFQACIFFALEAFIYYYGVYPTSSILVGVGVSVKYIALLFYPIFGFAADVWIGRHRMIEWSMTLCMIGWILLVIFNMLMWLHEGQGPMMLKMALAVLFITYICPGGFQSNIIPLNIDQLMGASGDELSATVYWHFLWTFLIPLMPIPLTYYFIFSLEKPLLYLTICLSIAGVSLMTAFIIYYSFLHWLDITPQMHNPIKQIFQVLNYARKNRHPQNRSALTYWEDTLPSRLDLGKDKYGGPFTVEQVEDVKTVLRLLPILICLIGCPLAWDGNNLTEFFSKPISYEQYDTLRFFIREGSFPYMLCIIQVLLYQFLFYPCFTNYVPSMLKKIALGLVFALITTLSYVEILLIGNVTLHSAPFPVPINYKWLLIPQATCSLALFLVIISSLEFIVAQSPKSMRALMVGLWFAALGLGKLLDRMMSMPFSSYEYEQPLVSSLQAEIASSVILFVVICIFVVSTKYYKLRVRENIVPVQRIAEEHYERYMEQSEEYKRTYGIVSSSESTT